MRSILALFALSLCFTAGAASGPYDETADARADIQSALAAARDSKALVLVVFGANWCGDCKVLDLSFKSGKTAQLVEKSFKVVKVDVGRFDRNVAVAEAYGVPLKQGIPAIAVLNADGKVAFATRTGELADARHMGDQGIYDFFAKLSSGAR